MSARGALVGCLIAPFVLRTARAEPTTPVVDPDGFVRVSTDLPFAPQKVDAVLTDSATTMTMGKDVIDVQVQVDGSCEMLAVRTRGFTQPMTYTARRCRTAAGWASTLVQSEDFSSHDVEWATTPIEEGTRVTMRVRVKPHLPVPQLLIRSVVGNAIVGTLKRLETILGG